MEVGSDSGWVSRELMGVGLDVRCVNARRLKMIAESTLKTDQLDAEILARLARISVMDAKLLPEVRHRSEKTQQERSVLKARGALVRSRTLLISNARGLARTMGHPLPASSPDGFPTRVRASSVPGSVKQVLEPTLESIEALTACIEKQEQQAAEVSLRHPVVEHLQEIDGVGLMTSLWFVLCVEDPARFERTRDIGAYFGFRPRVRKSSSIDRRGHVTKEGDVEMRRLLTQAAHCLLNTRRKSALQNWGKALATRVGRKKAIPAIARKLSVLMLTLWQTGATYEPFPQSQAVVA